MRPDTLVALSQTVLALHLAVIAFNIFGLVAIPLGAGLGWHFVRIRWWRLLHLISLLAVALQAMFGAACFLTLWQSSLREQAGEAASRAPLIQRTVESLVFLPLPFWSFTGLYLAVLAYTLVLWRLVPPRRAADVKQGWTSGPTGPKV